MSDDKDFPTKVDHAISGFLLFLLRYIRTFRVVLFHFARPDKFILDDEASSSTIVLPFTFLSIGAFGFAVIIDAYPNGFVGLKDTIWFLDEIKVNIRDRLPETLSVTSFVTRGLPVIITTVLLSSLFARLFFRESKVRTKWMQLVCYAVGYQTAMLFFLFSIDILIQTVDVLSPFAIGDSNSNPIVTGIVFAIAAAAILTAFLLPVLMFVFGALVWSRPSGMLRRIWCVVVVFAFAITLQYTYPAAASVVPRLRMEYYPDPEVSFMIFEEPVVDILSDGQDASVRFELLFENPTVEDALIELEALEVGIVVTSDPDSDDYEVGWRFSEIQSSDGYKSDVVRLIASSTSTGLVKYRVSGIDWQSVHKECVRLLSSKYESDISESTPLLSVYLYVSVNVRNQSMDPLEGARMLDDSLFLGDQDLPLSDDW